jgi:cysteinyl-tRNA synthetase
MTFMQLLLLGAVIGAVAVLAYCKGRNDSALKGPSVPQSRQPDVEPMPRKPVAVPPPVSSGGRAPEANAIDRRVTPTMPRPSSPALRDTSSAPSIAAERPRPQPPRSWGYQLQNFNLARAEASPFDLLVIDYAKDGSDDTALSAAEIARLKRRPDGGRRIVLAYLSIGEAESYRSYWDERWEKNKPGWLLGENPDWKENYAVCFWDPEWQKLMCAATHSRLSLIQDAGFDGVYLDKCDVFEDLKQRYKSVYRSRPSVRNDMIAFIATLGAEARKRDPKFLLVMQNAESLLDNADLRCVLDGVAKEELLFGNDAPEKKNDADDIAWSRERLDMMRQEGKWVLVVEYLQSQAKIQEAARDVADCGFVLYVAPKDRLLSRLNYQTLQA